MTKLRKRALLALVLLVLAAATFTYLAPVGATADGGLTRLIRLNDFTGSKQDHCVLTASGDGLRLAWDSRRQQGGCYGVYARDLDWSGRAAGPEFALNLHTVSHQMRPSLHGDLAVWESWGQDGSGRAVMGRIGAGDEFALAERTAGDQSRPVALALADGRLAAAWMTPGATPGAARIAARLFAADGAPLSGELSLSDAAGANDILPCLAEAGEGFVASWTRHAADGVPRVLARVFGADGRPLTDEIVVAEESFESSVAAGRDGGFAVAWLAADQGDTRVHVGLFDAAGRPLAPARALGDAGRRHAAAAVAANASGDFAVAWNSVDTAGDVSAIRVQRLAADGAPVGAPRTIGDPERGNRRLATASGGRRLLLADDGAIAVAWSGDSDQGDRSAANLSLLLPEAGSPFARLARNARLLLGDLAAGLRPTPPTDATERAAAPYQPPVFDPDAEPEPVDKAALLAAGRGRDDAWIGITSTGWNPPDPHMAVSVDHVMMIVNGGVAAFDREGAELWQLDINGAGGFWGDVGADSFVFDPEVVYDPHEDRFVVMANEREGAYSFFLLAVSATSDPAGDWHTYRIDVTGLADSDIDSPNLSLDDEAIYLSADFFAPDRYFIYIIDKSSVLDGGAPVATHYLHTGSQSFGMPVQYDDAPAMYMIQGFEGIVENQIRVWAIRDPLGSPSLVSHTLDVPTYYRPAYARSRGTSATIITFEARFWSCVYRNGSLWACHHISTEATRSTTSARWYEIEMNGWPDSGSLPTVRQSGTVLPNDTGYATFNSITVNGYGDAAMCFAYSSTNDYFTMMRVAREASDPLGTMGEPVKVYESQTAYTGSRWGDYSAVVVDPRDQARFWAAHEAVVGAGSWLTVVANFMADPLTAVPEGRPFWSGRATAAWPNPMRDETHLAFSLDEDARVALDIYDVSGRLVRRLAGGRFAPGDHDVLWDGRDDAGAAVAAGRYVTRLEVDGRAVPGHRLLLIR